MNIFDKVKKIDSPTEVGKQMHILVSLPIKNLNLMSPDFEQLAINNRNQMITKRFVENKNSTKDKYSKPCVTQRLTFTHFACTRKLHFLTL